jgi:hypothetical protein
LYCVEQILAQSPAPVVRKDADLFNVSVSIYDIDNDVADRSIELVHGNPTVSTADVVFQHLDRHGVRVGYPLHTNRPEHCSREDLDLSEPRTLRGKRSANAPHSLNTYASRRCPHGDVIDRIDS